MNRHKHWHIHWQERNHTFEDLYSFIASLLHCFIAALLNDDQFAHNAWQTTDDYMSYLPQTFCFLHHIKISSWSDWWVDAPEPTAALITRAGFVTISILYFHWNVSLYLFYQPCLQLCYGCIYMSFWPNCRFLCDEEYKMFGGDGTQISLLFIKHFEQANQHPAMQWHLEKVEAVEVLTSTAC